MSSRRFLLKEHAFNIIPKHLESLVISNPYLVVCRLCCTNNLKISKPSLPPQFFKILVAKTEYNKQMPIMFSLICSLHDLMRYQTKVWSNVNEDLSLIFCLNVVANRQHHSSAAFFSAVKKE
jgi:hypothetical protein